MTGTDKQVKWAMEIQANLIKVMAELDKTIEALNPNEEQRAVLMESTAVLRSFTTSTDAPSIINTYKFATGKGLEQDIVNVTRTAVNGKVYPYQIKLGQRTVNKILYVKADGEVVYRG